MDSLEQLRSESMAKSEFDYTTKMIKTNLSNFSAWHNRSKFILRTLSEQEASDEERKKMLDDGECIDLFAKRADHQQSSSSSIKLSSIRMISHCGSIIRI